MNICFWNIHKNKVTQCNEFNECLLEILNEHSVDLFCVSEYDEFDDSVLTSNGYKEVSELDCDKVKCYKKLFNNFTLVRADERFNIIKTKNDKILIVFAHLYDQRNSDDKRRLHCMEKIKEKVDRYVKKNGETAVFIVGDFNCMPYDDPLIDEEIFNCVLFRDLLNTRKDAQERYYNPMLLLLSESKKNYGSYYSDSAKSKNLRWYLFDQVIVNKNANAVIDYDSIEIISKTKNRTLLKNGKPNVKLYSDHLPLCFKIMED